MRLAIAMTTAALILVLGGVGSAETVDPIKMQLQGARYVLYTVPVPLFLAAGATDTAMAGVARLNKENC